jgi:uncharacterized membrane protein
MTRRQRRTVRTAKSASSDAAGMVKAAKSASSQLAGTVKSSKSAPRHPAARVAGVARAHAPIDMDAPTLRQAGASRIPALDAARGIAIIAMVVYHFCFDLRYFGITHSDFENDPRWLTARSLILGSFMLIAGVSLVLASRRTHASRRWLVHVAKIAAAALLVTAASAAMFPQSFIWFGVLHAIAVSLLLARPFVNRPALAAVVGIAVVLAGVTFTHPAFDSRALGWIGFMTAKPMTEDYVPLFPWAGVLLLGVAAGDRLMRVQFAPLAALGHAPRWLRLLGRHSLAIYLVHQPVLIGFMWLATRR